MIIVFMLRWLFGFVDFSVSGKFPERFLNLAARKGINLWSLTSNNKIFTAKVKIADYNELRHIAVKTKTRIHILKKHGLPFLIYKYKARSGLFVGAILFFVICQYLSGFIWNIDINVPDTINEYEIRSQLAELGFYEGIKNDNIDIHKIERLITLKNPGISWITINIMGTQASVEMSPNLSEQIDKSDEENKVTNIKAVADGTITRMEVRNGTALVMVGEGVRKGQLLVSGIIDYSDGSSSFVDSNAQIYAKTSRTVSVEVPLKLQTAEKNEYIWLKRDIDILGVKIPLTFNANPDDSYIKNYSRNQISIFNSKIPVYINEEKWQKYDSKSDTITEEQAEKTAKNRIELYEVFMLYSTNKGKILQKNYKVTKFSDKIVLTANYDIEEDIGTKSVLQVMEN